MKFQRIFVSSVMEGYADRRQAARQAIEAQGAKAIMAEDVGVSAGSPRRVILDELLPGCDAVIGIYGQRYGWSESDSGLSPTEEEYDKARELSKPIYAFVDTIEAGQPESRQKEFLDKVQNWDQGLTRNQFGSLKELKKKIKVALSGTDLSPRYRTFLDNLTRKAAVKDFRQTTQSRLPDFDLILHVPGSQFTAGVESFIAVVDGDRLDRAQLSAIQSMWQSEIERIFQLGFWRAKNAAANLVIAVERNPLGMTPAGLHDTSRWATCRISEYLVDVANGHAEGYPKARFNKPWLDPIKDLLQAAVSDV